MSAEADNESDKHVRLLKRLFHVNGRGVTLSSTDLNPD